MGVAVGPRMPTSGLVFEYDISNTGKCWVGKPTTNTCTFGQYNYTWGNGVVVRNTTHPTGKPPPITGYEIAKLTSTDGAETQTILYTATVDQVNGGVYTHSAWIYLESGTWVSVGQHWNPWDYGTQQFIPRGVWTRISYTLTNAPNNYGNIACSYNTNGTIYITGTQYELGSEMTPFVGGTRSNTQSILDLTKSSTITANSLTYANGTFTFNGSSDYFSWPDNLDTNSCTFIYIAKSSNFAAGQRNTPISQYYNGTGLQAEFQGVDGTLGTLRSGMRDQSATTPELNGPNNASILTSGNTYHVAVTYGSKTVTHYLNGSLLGSTTNSSHNSVDPTGDFNVGRNTGAGLYFNGSIYFVQIFNRVLSATEIKQAYDAVRGKYNLS